MLDCGCDENTLCPEASRLRARMLGVWFGEEPDCPADMFASTGAPQKQRLFAMRASLAFHRHRGPLTPQCVLSAIARASLQLFIPPPPRRLPVGSYGRAARVAMQLRFLESLAAGRSFIQASADLEADRRTIYSWCETDPAFAGAVERLRVRRP